MRNPRCLIACLCLLSAAACSPMTKAELPTRLDPQGLSTLQTEELYAAADDWFVASAGKLDLTGTDGPALAVKVGALGDKAGQTFFPGTGLRSDPPLHIVIDAARIEGQSAEAGIDPRKFYRNVFAHELGHVLGLDHVANTLMKETAYASEPMDCIDAETLESACANYGGCPADAHSTCG